MSDDALLVLDRPRVAPFVPAPRTYAGNMCGVRVPGLPRVPGGASDPALVLSWFYDRYCRKCRRAIRDAWRVRGAVDVLLSWPDSRSVKQSPAQFGATCRELIYEGFRPAVMLASKDYDPADLPGLLRNIAP